MKLRFVISSLALLTLVGACQDLSGQGGAGTQETGEGDAKPRAVDSRHEGVVEIDPDDAEMHEAVAKARETMEEARLRWQATPESMRGNWVIKWGAPVRDEPEDGGDAPEEALPRIEYVWVLPLHWSPFRIEGRLVSEPVGELSGGAKLGDLVSFPIEDLADWCHFLDGDPLGRREGGFTIDVLEGRGWGE